jgi:hypothetical protein
MYNTSLSGVPWDMSAWRDREKFRASGHLFSSTLFISLFCDCKIPERTSIYLSLVKSLLFHLSRAGYEVDPQSRLYSQTIDGQVQSPGFRFR